MKWKELKRTAVSWDNKRMTQGKKFNSNWYLTQLVRATYVVFHSFYRFTSAINQEGC